MRKNDIPRAYIGKDDCICKKVLPCNIFYYDTFQETTIWSYSSFIDLENRIIYISNKRISEIAENNPGVQFVAACYVDEVYTCIGVKIVCKEKEKRTGYRYSEIQNNIRRLRVSAAQS